MLSTVVLFSILGDDMGFLVLGTGIGFGKGICFLGPGRCKR